MNQSKTQKKNKKIPSIPFSLEEVYSLIQHEASEELYNRLRVWKASHDYQFIKSLQDVIFDYSSHNKKLTRQEKLLMKDYIDWLSIGLESDKFKSLSAIRLKDSNVNLTRNDNEEEESYQDILSHTGIL